MRETGDACTRWMAVSDRDALGEALSADETAFLRAHGQSCDACQREANVWHALAAIVDDPSEAPRPSRVARTRAPQHRARRYVVAGMATIAAAALFGVRAPRHGEPTAAPSASAVPAALTWPDPTVVLATRPGVTIEVDGLPAGDGEKLGPGSSVVARQGSACLVVEPNIRACLAQGSVARVSELGAQRRLELRTGRVSVELDPLPPGHSFGIVTAQGSAIAIGTAFSVEVPPGNAPVVTRVMHGRVLVRATDGREQTVAAHEQTSMRDAAPTALPAADEERQRALLVPSDDVETDAPDAAVPKTAPASKSASELLVAIRERHAEGDLDGAVASYRELFEQHRSSPQAHAALVPWGDLVLTRLDDPVRALAAFDRYLVRGGALEEEAAFGRIRALRALGRVPAERAAIETFLQRFSDGPLVPSLRERLRSLDER